jgi:DNA-binding MarR family transcriptional regulator
MNLTHRKARIADLPGLVELLLEDELGASRESQSTSLYENYIKAFHKIDNDLNQYQPTTRVKQVTMTSQVLCALEKRGLLKRSRKEGDERSKFSELTDAGVAKIQGAAKDLLAAEESFFKNLGESKQGFDKHLRSILQQQTRKK